MSKDEFTKFVELNKLNNEFHSFKDNVFQRQNTCKSQNDKDKDVNPQLQFNPVQSIDSIDIHVRDNHFQFNNNNNSIEEKIKDNNAIKIEYGNTSNKKEQFDNDYKNKKNNEYKFKNKTEKDYKEKTITPKNKKYLDEMRFTDFKKLSSNIDTSQN